MSEIKVPIVKRLFMKLIALLMTLLTLQATTLYAGDFYDIQAKDADGKNAAFSAYKGKVILIVNVASRCGYTPQYNGLEATYQKYKDQGFTILAFPCNQFGEQEPGLITEIKQFCSTKYNVTFPLFDKIEVNGDHRHPLYEHLTGTNSPFPGKVTWNFNKFLIGKDGKILNRFDSKITPESPELTRAIESALATK